MKFFYATSLTALLAGLFLFGFVEKAAAQEAEFALNFQIGVPQGDFGEKLDRTGYGISGMAGYRLPYSPLMLGIDAGFLTFGTDRRRVPISPTIPDVTVQVDNSYNMANFSFFTRLTGRDIRFRPYVDALIGFNYLYTDSTIRDRRTQEEVVSDTNFDDFAFAYGLGGGFRVLIWEGVAPQTSRAYFNVNARYMRGGNAEYVRPGSIDTSGGELTFDVLESRTDILNFNIGFTVNF
ncbi:Outer membrane protein beta-barrel domain-containing protein [Cyclonatronum proteinivorum]|uniref:Outer membrane protein beta-barrel domain-containing protein n=1 Tax=Cyclonatronum proteinivorum TaxID=1457365 RepID=A0A345UNG2_9BACT|nr:outer membrane beta-barrel protein [Cyclonatronum proteinivorum]AXJ02014.1 Outer membrane protein beta-barrel domain-containing protein [Cyclonatronum proteinivorum]